jgi:hypothetical protein
MEVLEQTPEPFVAAWKVFAQTNESFMPAKQMICAYNCVIRNVLIFSTLWEKVLNTTKHSSNKTVVQEIYSEYFHLH